MRLTWLPDVIRNAGLTVVVDPGWDTRGRDFIEPVRGVVAHHTATPAGAPGDYPSLRIVRDGRSDVPGPLSQLGLGRSGTVYVIASGRANHAGSGSYPGLLGNRDTIGIEAEHPGTISHPWDTHQLACYYRLCAALLDRLRLPSDRLIGHKEWAPTRKIDPIGLDMNRFRNDVQTVRDQPPTVGEFPMLPIYQGDHEQGRRSDIIVFQRWINRAFGTHRLNEDGVYGVNMAARIVELGVAAGDTGEDVRAGKVITGAVAADLWELAVRGISGGTGSTVPDHDHDGRYPRRGEQITLP